MCILIDRWSPPPHRQGAIRQGREGGTINRNQALKPVNLLYEAREFPLAHARARALSPPTPPHPPRVLDVTARKPGNVAGPCALFMNHIRLGRSSFATVFLSILLSIPSPPFPPLSFPPDLHRTCRPREERVPQPAGEGHSVCRRTRVAGTRCLPSGRQYRPIPFVGQRDAALTLNPKPGSRDAASR